MNLTVDGYLKKVSVDFKGFLGGLGKRRETSHGFGTLAANPPEREHVLYT